MVYNVGSKAPALHGAAIGPYGQLLTPISSTSAVSEYKYGGKEWDGTTLSYDFGARNYIPAIPRWSTMDPLAEKYYAISPYVYCAGNPVNLVDEDGLSTRVKRLPDGTYEVIGGNIKDGDSNIYYIQRIGASVNSSYLCNLWQRKSISGYGARGPTTCRTSA